MLCITEASRVRTYAAARSWSWMSPRATDDDAAGREWDLPRLLAA
ncbi:hypothetical protein [Rhodococcus sp. ZPP]|nr:hypothetical protein [Rhodococcus sp. ZPP]